MLQAAAEQALFNPLLNRIDLLVGREDLNQYHWSVVRLGEAMPGVKELSGVIAEFFL